MTEQEKDAVLLETKKVKALEKIATSVEVLALWFEETDKQEWSDRIQYYLAAFHEAQVKKTADGE
jgi:hypothetical protein